MSVDLFNSFLFMFFHCNSIGNDSNSRHLPEILKYCWKLSSSLLIFFYSSMILVHLIASNKKYIETFKDLANADVMTTITLGTVNEVTIRVNIICENNI